jgi:hypothetical protein
MTALDARPHPGEEAEVRCSFCGQGCRDAGPFVEGLLGWTALRSGRDVLLSAASVPP